MYLFNLLPFLLASLPALTNAQEELKDIKDSCSAYTVQGYNVQGSCSGPDGQEIYSQLDLNLCYGRKGNEISPQDNGGGLFHYTDCQTVSDDEKYKFQCSDPDTSNEVDMSEHIKNRGGYFNCYEHDGEGP